jgi:hypothetical protein
MEDSVAPKSKLPTKMFFILFNVGLSIVRARRGRFGFGQVVAGRQKLLFKSTTGFELERQPGHHAALYAVGLRPRRLPPPAIKLLWITTIALPAFVIAALFLANWLKHDQLRARA